MARFLELIKAGIEELKHNWDWKDGQYSDRDDTLDEVIEILEESNLDEMENDLQEIVDEMTHLIKDGNTVPYMKLKLESMRYRLASYVSPICCVCGESTATWSKNGDGWYCERCVEVEK
jgi:hypothetical protein